MDKRYLTHVLFYLVLTVFGLALIAEIGYQFYDSVYESVETVDMTASEYRQTIDTVGFFGRQETVLTADSAGICRTLVPDGELVSSGQNVVGVYADSAGNDAAMEQIREIEGEISTLESAQTLASGYTPASVERAIAELRAMLVREREKGDLAAVRETESTLRLMLSISRIVTGKVPSYKDEIAALNRRLDQTLSELGSPAQNVKSTGSGRFYSHVDGYENALDFSSPGSLTAKDCLSALDRRQDGSGGGGGSVGKLADAFTWYLICETDPDQSQMLSVGSAYSVDLRDQGRSVELTLYGLYPDEESGRIAAVFRADRIPEGMDFTRFQSVSVVISSTQGYEIPTGALRIVDGVSGVYVLHGSVVQFREIQSLYCGDGYVFSPEAFESDSKYAHLSFYDRVIVKGKDLYVGKIVD